MKVQLLSCKPKGHPFPILSWLIMWFQKTNYSHNAIKYGNFVIDASGKDVRVSSSWDFLNRYEIVEEINIELDSNFEQFVNWTLMFVNKKYGFFQLIGIALKFFGLAKTNWFGREEKNLICSELIILLLRDFKGLKVKDSDEYDLNSTWKLAKQYEV